MSDPAAEARSLSDGDINVELSAAILGFDPSEKYPEWSNSSMREAYRAGYEDGLRQAIAERDAANAEVERLRAGYAAAIHDLHFWAGCIHSNESIQDSMHSAARAHETRLGVGR